MLDLLADGPGATSPVPWPPPGGLPEEHDPFAAPKPAAPVAFDELPSFGGPREPEPERKRFSWGMTPDRAGALSLLLHLLLFVLFFVVPPPGSKAPDEGDVFDPLGLMKLWSAPPPEPPIPVEFFPAPGPKAPAPGPRPRPSDMDRRAHGGDPQLPKAESPRAVPQPGVRELAPGKSGEREAAAAPPPKGQESGAPGGRTAEAAEAEEGQAPGLRGLKGIPGGSLREMAATGAVQPQTGRTGRSGEAGDAGGGWDADGGFVDSGPLSFDTAGYEWGPYAAEMVRKIKRNWEIPQLAHYGVKGRLVLRFFILADGRVEGLRILQSSGIPPYDNAAFMAVKNSSPFRPLPADLGTDREGVTVTFLYNVRADELDRESAPRRPAPR